jgi:hypothetical protein
MEKEIGDGVLVFMGGLTIFNESGAILLVFATAYLVSLARFPDLIYLFQALVTQIQVRVIFDPASERPVNDFFRL